MHFTDRHLENIFHHQKWSVKYYPGDCVRKKWHTKVIEGNYIGQPVFSLQGTKVDKHTHKVKESLTDTHTPTRVNTLIDRHTDRDTLEDN